MVKNMCWQNKVEVEAKDDKKIRDMLDILLIESIKKEKTDDRRYELHITDLVNPCPRAVWYYKVYADEVDVDDKGILKMWSGSKLHETSMSNGHEFPLEYKFADGDYGTIIGSVDEIIGDMVVDKKFYGFLPKEAYEHHVRQVMYYMALLWKMGKKVRYGVVYYIERKNFSTKAFVFEMKEEDLKNVFEELLEKAEYLRKNLVEGIIPKKVVGWMCRYCKFKEKCSEEGGDKNE